MATDIVVDDDRFKKVREDFYTKLGLAQGQSLDKKQKAALSKEALAAAAAEEKKAKAAHEAERKAARDKVIYEDRRARTESTIAALRDYAPASDGLIARFRESLVAADALVQKTPPAYEAATKALHAESVKKALARAEAAWADAEASARKPKAPTAALFARVDQLNQKLTAARAMLPAATVARLREEVVGAQRLLIKPEPSAADLAKAGAELDRIGTLLLNDVPRAESLRANALAARSRADAELKLIDAPDPLGALVTEANRAVLQRIRTGGDTALGAHEFELALTQFTELESRARSYREAGAADRAAWAQRAGELVTLVADARALAGTATSPAVKASVGALADQLAEAQALKPGADIAFRELLARLNGGLVRLADCRAEEAEFVAFTSERDAAAERIRVLDEAAEVAFQPLRAQVLAVTKGKDNDLADRTFLDRLTKVRAEWSDRLAKAQNVNALDEAAAATELRKIARDIASAVRHPKRVARLIDDEELRVAQEAYTLARQKAIAEVTPLTNIDALEGARLLGLMDDTHARLGKKSARGAWVSATEEMGRLGLEARAAAQRKLALVAGLQLRLKQLLDPLPGKLAEMFTAVRAMRNDAKQKLHAEMHQTLVTEVDALRAMGKLTQIPLLNDAIDDAEKLTKDVDMSVAAATKGEMPGGEEVLSFSEAKKRLAKLKSRIDASDVQIYAKVSAFNATETLEALEKGLGSTTLSKLDAALEDLAVTVTKLETTAADAKAAFKEFESKDVAPVQAKLDAAPLKDAKAYVAATKGRLASVLSDARFEGGLADARAALKRIADELKQVAESAPDETGAPRALAGKEAAAVKAQQDAEVQKSKYEAEVLVLRKQIEGAKGLFPDDHEGLREALNDAEKAAKKGADYEGAREQLRSIRTRLSQLTQNPQGLGIHVRKQLPAVNLRYKRAVSGYWKGLDAVAQAIAALPAADLPDAAKGKVRKELGEIRVLYNPAVFDRSIAIAANEGTEAKERSAARENALRETRRLSAYLREDFRLQELADTPFHPPMRGLLSELRLALLDLENNLLVSL